MTWEKRAGDYDKIKWVKDDTLLSAIRFFLDLRGNETIADIGAGTGVLIKYLKGKGHKGLFFACDSSKEMLDLIEKSQQIQVKQCEAVDVPLPERSVDRVVFRMLLHHCIGCLSEIITEAYRVLRPGGMVLLCEGIAPSNESYPDFARILLAKEDRMVFTEEQLITMLHPFLKWKAYPVVLRQQSICNWLDNCVYDKKLKRKIKEMHISASDEYKKAANMKILEDDILVDMWFYIVVAVKHA